MDRLMKALGDPTRWLVVQLLSEGERCVCDLESEMGIAQSRLSYHLGVLRAAGIVSDRRSGRWSYYSLRPEGLDGAAEVLRELSGQWSTAGRFRKRREC